MADTPETPETADEFDGLSDEERAALTEPDAEGEHDLLAPAIPDDEPVKDETADWSDTDEEEDSPAPTDAPAETAPPADPQPEPAPAAAAAPAPVPVGPAPEWTADQAARLEALPAERAKLIEQFNDGELSTAELTEKLAAMEQERDGLVSARATLETWQRQTAEAATASWQAALNTFAAANPALFAGFKEGASEEQAKAAQEFDKIVIGFANGPLAEGLTDAEILAESKLIFDRRFGAAPAAQPAPKPKATVRTDARPEAPPTLARMPAAALADADESFVGQMERLAEEDGLAYEDRFNRMTPEQEAAYLRAAERRSA